MRIRAREIVMPIGEFCAVRGGDVFDSSKDMIEQLEELFKGNNIHMYCLSAIYTAYVDAP